MVPYISTHSDFGLRSRPVLALAADPIGCTIASSEFMSAKATIVTADPKLWRKAFIDLRPSVVLCPGFALQSWGGTHESCVEFLDRWADEAAGLGWTTLELSGVHPEAETIRPDFCGAMVLSAEQMSAITDKHMRFGNMTFYRDRRGRLSGAVPLWLFGG